MKENMLKGVSGETPTLQRIGAALARPYSCDVHCGGLYQHCSGGVERATYRGTDPRTYQGIRTGACRANGAQDYGRVLSAASADARTIRCIRCSDW